MKTLPLAVVGIALTAVLAGCSTPSFPASAPTPIPVVTATATPTETPTLEPTATAEPAPSKAEYGFDFFHEATVGSSFEQMSAELGYTVTGQPECPYFGAVDQGSNYAVFATTEDGTVGPGTGFFSMVADYGSTGPYPLSAAGVGLGNTEAEVLAAYPGSAAEIYHDPHGGDVRIIPIEDPATGNRIVFQVVDGTVHWIQFGHGAGLFWHHLCGGT